MKSNCSFDTLQVGQLINLKPGWVIVYGEHSHPFDPYTRSIVTSNSKLYCRIVFDSSVTCIPRLLKNQRAATYIVVELTDKILALLAPSGGVAQIITYFKPSCLLTADKFTLVQDAPSGR